MKTFLTFSLLLFWFSVSAQDYYNADSSKVAVSPKNTEAESNFFLGIASGINNDAGLFGIGGKVRLYRTLFFRAGAGIGTWGKKVTFGFKYERKYSKCWGYSLSYSTSSGIKDFKTQLETAAQPAPVTKDVTIDLLRAGSLNLAVSYNWYFKRNKHFYFEFGYSAATDSRPWRVKDGSVLTKNSETVLSIIQPGGIIIGMGFMFGL